MNQTQYESSVYRKDVEGMARLAEQLRTDANAPQDISLGDVFSTKHEGLKLEDLYTDLGIDPSVDTIQNLYTMPDNAPRWIVAEAIRDAIRLGLRKAPIYPNIIAGEQSMGTVNQVVPHINMSDAAPRYVNEAETMTFTNLTYGSKSFKVRKMGRGVKITDEVKQYVSLDLVAIFLQDFGVKLGYALDSLAIDCLLNGEQADGSQSAPVIGVATIGTIVYRDLLKIWIRLSRLGRSASTMIAGESTALDILDLAEFKLKTAGTTQATINVKTPIPNSASLFIHGSIPTSQVIILDPRTAMMKYNARPLLIESERVVSNQTEATYASLTTGFATLMQDARLVLDKSLAFGAAGFPTYMNVDAMEVETIK